MHTTFEFKAIVLAGQSTNRGYRFNLELVHSSPKQKQ